MVNVKFNESQILSLQSVGEIFADKYNWKSFSVDAKAGKFSVVTHDSRNISIELSGFAYDNNGNYVRECNVDFRKDIVGGDYIFGKNDDDDWVIVHD